MKVPTFDSFFTMWYFFQTVLLNPHSNIIAAMFIQLKFKLGFTTSTPPVPRPLLLDCSTSMASYSALNFPSCRDGDQVGALRYDIGRNRDGTDDYITPGCGRRL